MIGAGNPPASRLSLSGRLSASVAGCLTQAVRITLASEQISFCAPTSLPFNVVEDSSSDPYVSYAGLDQMDGFGIVNIRATVPGTTPGPGRPIYNSGEVIAYRQAVWKTESSKTDRIASSGPTGLFWNESVPSIKVDLILPTSSGDLKVRSIEWYVEHNNRLWSTIISWDTELQNASEWEAASRNISVQKNDSEHLADTAINLGTAFQESKVVSDIPSMGAPVDVGTPSWWSGVCNDNNFFAAMGKHSFLLDAAWHGVPACGPKNSFHLVRFFTGAWGEFEFQCVELVMRFLYQQWGIAPWAGNGNTIKDSPPGAILFYPNNGAYGIVPGDIITENASTQNSFGHTVIVTDISHLDGYGTGTINIMEQNASSGGQRSLTVQNWQIKPDAWCYGQTIQGWLHVKGNQEDGNPDPAFVLGSGPNGRVNAIAIHPNGKSLIAGDFSSYNGTSVKNIARLNSDGSLDSTFDPGVGVATTGGSTPKVYTVAVYSDGNDKGKVLIGGHFESYNGTPRTYIVRLNSDGSLDTTFTPGMEINADIYKIVIQADGKILVGGAGILRRLNSNGSLDLTFTGSTDNSVRDIAVQSSDGKVIIGGNFSKVNETNRAGIARLNSDGSLDTTLNPGSGTGAYGVASIALDADGKVLIGGNFTSYNGASRNKVARLNSNGSLDGTFNPGTGISGSSTFVQTIVAQPDGKILIGGDFSSYNGAALNHIGRLNYDGLLDTNFYASTDDVVQALVLQSDGKIIIGGDFTNHVSRLLNHLGSCYTLTSLVSPIAGGSLTVNPAMNCPGSKYLSGTQAQITPFLNPDYWLVNWSGDASGSANPLNVTMTGNTSVTANLMASPGGFDKVAPGNGATGLPANPSLSWGTSDGASSYEYCLDTTNNDECDSGTWVPAGVSTNVSLSNLLPSFTYYWQARARNLVDTTDGGPWWSFTRNGIPAVPVTVSPNGTIFIDDQPAFVWDESSGASSYNLIVHSISTSTDVIDEVVDSSSCLEGVCSYHPSDQLPVGDYEFRVSAQKDAGTSDFSNWRPFTVVVGEKIFLPLVSSPGN